MINSKYFGLPWLITPLLVMAAQPSSTTSIGATLPWEEDVGARLTSAMEANVIEVPAGDCEAVNRAISLLPLDGGTIKLGPGRFDCARPVAIERDGVRLQGAGREATVLRLNDKTSKPVIVIGVMKAKPETVELFPGQFAEQWYPINAVQNVIVEDLAVDGNRVNQYTVFLGPDFLECYDQDRDVGTKCDATPEGPAKFIRNNGITIRGAERVTVQRVRADRAISGGLVTEKRCRHLLVHGFESEDSVFDGFAGYETTESLFRDMVMSRHLYSGVSIDLGFNGNVFDGFKSIDNLDNGVFSMGVAHNTYRNVEVRGNKNYGFFFGGRFPWGSQVMVPGSCDGQRMFNARIEDNGTDAIRFADECRKNVIENSVLRSRPGRACIGKHPGAEVTLMNSDVCEP